MTGQITGITTLNCTTGIFNSISTTGTTNVAIPSLGNFGGTGDKLILYPGTSTIYPYSLGIETNSLWMSSPNTIKLYNNGINSLLIDSSGNIGIGKTPSVKLDVSGNMTVSGLSLLNRITTYNNTFPDLTAVNNATTHSMINIFPGLNGQQGALAADTYNIYLSSFAYGSSLSGPQPYITVNCTTLYNGSNTKLTLQAYGGATGAG